MKEVTTRIFSSPVETQKFNEEVYQNYSAPAEVVYEAEEHEEKKSENEK